MRRTWTDDQLQKVVSTSTTYVEVYRKLGLIGNRHESVIRRMAELGIDAGHFHIRCKRTGPQVEITLEDILHSGKYFASSYVKTRLLSAGLLEYRCADCGIAEWRGRPLTLQLHHKDGNNRNNKIVNLSLLCPNCHAQTPTYCNGWSKRKMEKVLYVCILCRTQVSTGCRYCVSCAPNTKVSRDWPSMVVLRKLMEEKGPLETSRHLEVSRNMLYCHLKKNGFYSEQSSLAHQP